MEIERYEQLKKIELLERLIQRIEDVLYKIRPHEVKEMLSLVRELAKRAPSDIPFIDPKYMDLATEETELASKHFWDYRSSVKLVQDYLDYD